MQYDVGVESDGWSCVVECVVVELGVVTKITWVWWSVGCGRYRLMRRWSGVSEEAEGVNESPVMLARKLQW